MRRLIVPALLLLTACRRPALQDTDGTVRLSPAVLDFSTAVRGQSRALTLRLRNDGPPTLVRWTAPPAPFFLSADQLPTEAPSGELELAVRFAPEELGTFTGALRVDAEGLASSQVSLLGAAVEIPGCWAPRSCHRIGFDLSLGRCVETALPDGLACETASRCLRNPTCVAGRCVGVENSCDDSNACTIDTCNPVTGCEHLPAPPCPGDGHCQLGVCHPATGCGFAPAEDGSSCGSLQTCVAAEVCISGACVVRDPPDGHVCAEASPCQGEGVCVGPSCVRAPATALAPTWNFDALTADAGAGSSPNPLHQLLLEADGSISLAGPFSATPRLRHNTPQSKEPAMGLAGRCLLWNGRLVCSKPNDSLTGADLATGASLWTFNLRTARPDFKVGYLFVARMAVQSSDRLAVLWEGYPEQNNCRVYFLSVLDAGGALVSAQQLSDASLNGCNHPHAYGFAADAVGNLFIAFAPTIKNPPLVSGAPTAVLSYTRDGVFRWRFNDVALKGGELAVARGLLYSENGATAILTSTGQPAFTLGRSFGRLVVSQQRLVVAPRIGATGLEGYEPGTATIRWSHSLASGQEFASDQVRLASWTTRAGPQPVVLTFTRQNGQTQLHAIIARDGREAFSCALSTVGRTAPQQFEIADGQLGMMDGADGCASCEPAFSDKSAAFHSFEVPTISRALLEPWVGVHGGPGQAHREQ